MNTEKYKGQKVMPLIPLIIHEKQLSNQPSLHPTDIGH
jgi:hypothetical protein